MERADQLFDLMKEHFKRWIEVKEKRLVAFRVSIYFPIIVVEYSRMTVNRRKNIRKSQPKQVIVTEHFLINDVIASKRFTDTEPQRKNYTEQEKEHMQLILAYYNEYKQLRHLELKAT